MKSLLRAMAFAAYVFLPMITLTAILHTALLGGQAEKSKEEQMHYNSQLSKNQQKEGNAVSLLFPFQQNTFFNHF